MSARATAWAWKLVLPVSQKMVLLALADEADAKAECFPSMATIAEMCGMTRRNVVNCLHKLEEGGFIRHEKRHSANGHRSSNLYTLNLPVDADGAAQQAIHKAAKRQSEIGSPSKGQSENSSLSQSENNNQSETISPSQSEIISPITESKPTSPNGEEAEASEKPMSFTWTVGVELLTSAGIKQASARATLGKLIKTHGEAAVEEALLAVQAKQPADPLPYLHAVLRNQKAKPKAVLAGDDWMGRLL